MRRIAFSHVGVPVESMEEVEEIYMMYSALDIAFEGVFKDRCIDAQQHNLVGYFIQSTRGDITTKNEGDLSISLINYPIAYSMEAIDFAVACQLINTDQEDELIAHLDKYCKEYT